MTIKTPFTLDLTENDLQTGITTYTDDDGTMIIHQAAMSQADNLET